MQPRTRQKVRTRALRHAAWMTAILGLVCTVPAGAQVDLIVNGSFEGGFTSTTNPNPLDGSTPDDVPNGWIQWESFTGGVVEMSALSELAANGPSLPGSSALGVSRTGGGVSGDQTTARQDLNVDASYCSALTLSIDAMVTSHNLEAGGLVSPAFEWPATVEILYRTTSGAMQLWRYGWYVDPPGDGSRVNDPGEGLIPVFRDQQVVPGVWTSNTFDLFAELPELDTITRILVGGAGWDFESAIDNVELLCTVAPGINLLVNGDFEWGFSPRINPNPLDGWTPDDVPNGWIQWESFTGGGVETSRLSENDFNGPSLPGWRSLEVFRSDGGASGDQTTIRQDLDIDGSACGSGLRLHVDVAVVSHNLEAGGFVAPAFEWPATVEILYRTTSGADQLWRYGWYVDPPGDGGVVDDPGHGLIPVFHDEEVLPDVWHSKTFDLSAELPELDTITRIIVGGAGWDFHSVIDNVEILCLAFADGFESGDTSAWTSTVP